jgi:hypothetical protein
MTTDPQIKPAHRLADFLTRSLANPYALLPHILITSRTHEAPSSDLPPSLRRPPRPATPAPTELPASPFVIKDTWFIGGAGNWDYLTMDPQTSQLLIAHGPVVQVVDTETGTLAGQITGLRFAHSIALDDSGEFGFVSDGPANQVAVFDRRTFKIIARVPAGPNPRALVFEPQTRLLFAVSSDLLPQSSSTSRPANQPKSSVTVIDSQARAAIATILLPGKLGFAATNGAGQLYIVLLDLNEIVWIDVAAIEPRLRGAPPTSESPSATPARAPGSRVTIDWSSLPRTAQSTGNHIRFFFAGLRLPRPPQHHCRQQPHAPLRRLQQPDHESPERLHRRVHHLPAHRLRC